MTSSVGSAGYLTVFVGSAGHIRYIEKLFDCCCRIEHRMSMLFLLLNEGSLRLPIFEMFSCVGGGWRKAVTVMIFDLIAVLTATVTVAVLVHPLSSSFVLQAEPAS